MAYEGHRDKINKAKMEQMTQMYFQNEHNLIQNVKAKHKTTEFFYTKDFVNNKPIPDYRKK